MAEESVRVGIDDDGDLDELVVRDAKSVHLERMDDGVVWVEVERQNGQRLAVWLHRKGKAIRGRVEVDP